MRRVIWVFGCVLAAGWVVAAEPYRVTIDGRSVSHVFQGLGAIASYEKLLYDYPEPQRSEILDLMFKPKGGAALQILKVEIGYDGNNTAVSWPSHQRTADETPDFTRGWVWWLMEEAKKRNPEIKLAALNWGYPAWAVTDPQKARFIFDFVRGAKEAHGLTIDVIGGNQNESVIRPEVTIALRGLLNQAGYTRTQIIVADEGSRGGYSVGRRLQENRAYLEAVDLIGLHYKGRRDPLAEEIVNTGRPVWSSEDGGGWYLSGVSGNQWAHQIVRLLTDVRLNAIIRWQLTASAYDNMAWPNGGLIGAKEPWGGFYKVGGNLWAFAHVTQLTEPGWNVLKLARSRFFDGDEDSAYAARMIAFADPGGTNATVVFTTKDTRFPEAGLDVGLCLTGGLTAERLYVWRSFFDGPEKDWFVRQPALALTNNGGTIHLDRDCVYTLSTVADAEKPPERSIPKRASFPLPYSTDFESDTPGRPARYFVDASGTFEVAKAGGGRTGNVLRQVIEDAPTPWHPGSRHIAQPLTEVGGMSWTDYALSVDVLLEKPGTAAVCGRFDGTREASEDYLLEGYWFFLDSGGTWRLMRKDGDPFVPTETVKYRPPRRKGHFIALASGKLASGSCLMKWTSVRLVFKGSVITAFVNGEQVAEVTDARYANGNVALGSLAPDTDDFFHSTPKIVPVQFGRMRFNCVESAPEGGAREKR